MLIEWHLYSEREREREKESSNIDIHNSLTTVVLFAWKRVPTKGKL